MTQHINIIVAVDRTGAIGRGGDLLYHISADLRNFRQLTTGHTVLMGRRTFESLPKGALPHRRNIVITHNDAFEAPGAEAFGSLEAALAATAPDEQVFIIGGGQVYERALPLAVRLFITEIDAGSTDADTYFPTLDPDDWHIDTEDDWQTDEKSGRRFRFVTLSRRTSQS